MICVLFSFSYPQAFCAEAMLMIASILHLGKSGIPKKVGLRGGEKEEGRGRREEEGREGGGRQKRGRGEGGRGEAEGKKRGGRGEAKGRKVATFCCLSSLPSYLHIQPLTPSHSLPYNILHMQSPTPSHLSHPHITI